MAVQSLFKTRSIREQVSKEEWAKRVDPAFAGTTGQKVFHVPKPW
jgi:hypothetical protein